MSREVVDAPRDGLRGHSLTIIESVYAKAVGRCKCGWRMTLPTANRVKKKHEIHRQQVLNRAARRIARAS